MEKGILYPYIQKIAPVQYINVPGVIGESGKYLTELGKRALISGGVKALGAVESQLVKSLDEYGIKWAKHIFTGYCSDKNVGLIKEKARECSADFIIGVGGGRALDAAKAAADQCEIPVVTIPTIAATCAASTAVSIIYNDKGAYDRDYYLTTNPRLVLIDPGVIAKAPVEYLASGIFDAIAKWYEGEVIVKGIDRPDIFTASAIELSRLLNRRMSEEALKAIDLVNKKEVGDALLQVIDLNIFITGAIQSFGQSTCRGAIAHSIHNGLTIMEESHEILHGFKVGYGIVVQIYVENWPEEEVKKVVSFFRKLGLEPSLKGLNLPNDEEIIRSVAEKTVNDPLMKRMPYRVTAEMIVSAIEQLERDIDSL